MSRTKTKRKKKLPLDVIVTTAGRYDVLVQCLDALENQTARDEFHIRLIDGNDDIQERNQNREILDKYSAKKLGENVGFPRLSNAGARMGNASLILFISDDVVLRPDAIELMLETMKDDSIGILGTKLLFPEDSVDPIRPAGKVQHIGLAMDIEASIIHPLVGWSADNPKCCVSRDCFAVTGASFLIRRNLFNQVGGWDEDYGLGTYEDSSLCISVRSLGKRVYINTDIVGYHHVGATVQKKQIGFPLHRNKQIFDAKWSQSGAFVFDSWTYY